jgi:hypothetical protein
MSESICDGTGDGFKAKVDKLHRLHVDSVTFGRSELEVELGNGFNTNTGILNLTTANKSGVLYFKNLEDSPVVITTMFYLFGESNASGGEVLVDVLRNPTTGTIISDAVDAEMAGVNRNFGSSKLLEADIYKGGEGKTFTNGEKLIESLFSNSPNRHTLRVGDLVLPKGSSIGFNITPPAGNTDMNVEFAFSCFVDTLAEDNT